MKAIHESVPSPTIVTERLILKVVDAAVWQQLLEQLTDGEIMEFMGCNPGVVSRSFHWMDLNSTNFLRTLNNVVVSDNPNAFHVYGVERTQNSLKFFIDTNYYCTVTADSTMASNLLSKPYYLLINTAFGGSAAGYVDDSILPQKYYISWVRVFDMTSGPLPGP